MTRTDLKLMVRTVLNEYGENYTFSLELGQDAHLDDYIERALPDAVALLATDGKWVNPKSVTPTTEDGLFVLPEDYLSLIVVKLKEWNIPQTRLVEAGSPEYRRAFNKFTEPGINSPVCLRYGNDKMKCLPAGEMETFVYNAMLADGEYSDFNGDEKACKAVVYMAAALVFSYFENDSGKQRMSELATLYMR